MEVLPETSDHLPGKPNLLIKISRPGIKPRVVR